MSDVAEAAHNAMSWKCKRFPNGFCSLCAILTTVFDLIWDHRKKKTLGWMDCTGQICQLDWSTQFTLLQCRWQFLLLWEESVLTLMEARWTHKVLNSRESSLHLLGEFSDSWDGSQSLRIFYVVIDVCAKATVLDAPKGGTNSSRNEKSNPIKFLFPRGHSKEENLSGFGKK